MPASPVTPDLRACVEALAALHPPGEALSDPLALILWENIGYLIDDARRRVLFDEFAARVGLGARDIDAADGAVLLDIARRGGMRPETRVDRWRQIARITLDHGGDLGAALAALPPAKAQTLLKRFPVIGDPGADKIALFAGLALTPALESNGLRVLIRLGLVAEQKTYTASYRAGVEVLRRDGVMTRDWLVGAYIALREHGKALCKRGAPLCLACVLDPVCAHVPTAQ